jgi:serine phosphatase RsbU (regulator of sigma subunit)
MYGAERLQHAVMHIDSTMNAERILETLLGDATDFVGSAEQYDDMIVVVVKKR